MEIESITGGPRLHPPLAPTATKPIDRDLHAFEDFVGGSEAIDRNDLALAAVVVEQGGRLPLEARDPLFKHHRIVIRPFSSQHSLHELLAWHHQLDNPIDAHRSPLKHVIKCFRLRKRAWKAVEQIAASAVGFGEPAVHHPENDRVWHELPFLHRFRRLEARRSSSTSLRPEHFTGRQMGHPEPFDEPLALRPFSSAGRPDEDDPHGGCHSLMERDVAAGEHALRQLPSRTREPPLIHQFRSRRPL